MNPIGQELAFIMSHFSGCLVTTSSKASAPLGHMLLEGAIVGIGIGGIGGIMGQHFWNIFFFNHSSSFLKI